MSNPPLIYINQCKLANVQTTYVCTVIDDVTVCKEQQSCYSTSSRVVPFVLYTLKTSQRVKNPLPPPPTALL